jgi:hypothetical protein
MKLQPAGKTAEAIAAALEVDRRAGGRLDRAQAEEALERDLEALEVADDLDDGGA